MSHKKQSLRKRTLVISYLYPSSSGSGVQIRAAALVQMLAVHEDVYLLVINRYDTVLDPVAVREMEKICQKILYVNCQSGQSAATIKRFYDENKLNTLFIFRIETYFLMKSGLDSYPTKYLDLDELSSRRNDLIADLKSKTSAVSNDLAANHNKSILQLIEKKIIPLFNKVFVSSELEANEVCKLTGSNNIYVLPNVLPSRILNPRQPAIDPQEILFVGSFFYYPNEDAIHYFCRDIFPLIRENLGDQLFFVLSALRVPSRLRS